MQMDLGSGSEPESLKRERDTLTGAPSRLNDSLFRESVFPVSSRVLRPERTIGQPFEMLFSISGSKSSSSWVTVSLVEAATSSWKPAFGTGSISKVTREVFAGLP